ncbi:hypothetical protein Vretimale_15326 [Volvox reticuliferus]|uniref:Methyltransferase FkbM domain-containing protein n=1 Tax=Volvox reticuliferus TaxID=1737510 RepID=A0A8J4CTL0_9CHLO|nr:hypothetical protein Vretifemale_16443 [Volvox reticuliferus]GIM11920.1 hypothetical protein Vretimale_15326 [Volvox reticuliferus]
MFARKISWQVLFIGLAGFTLGLVFRFPGVSMPKEDIVVMRNAYADAEYLAEVRGVKIREIGFGIRARTLIFKDKSFVMVLPLNSTFLMAWHLYNRIMDFGGLHNREDDFAVDIFSRFCGKSGPQLVLDVGTNIGYYSLLAAVFGCRVMAFDGNLEALAYMKISLAMNGFSDRVKIVEALVSNVTDVQFDGFYANLKNNTSSQTSPAYVTTRSVQLDDLVHQQALYAKIDVEAWEPAVFASAKKMFRERPPLYLFFEMTYWQDTWRYGYIEIFTMLKDAGYTCDSSILQRVITMPTTKNDFDAMLKSYDFICDRTRLPFCQDEFICILPSAIYNPLSNKSQV